MSDRAELAKDRDARQAKLYRELMADPVMQAIKEHLAAGLKYAAKMEGKKTK